MKFKLITLAATSVFVFVLSASFVFAEDGMNTASTFSGTPKPRTFVNFFDSSRSPDPSESPEPAETPRPFQLRIDRLKDLRLKFCEVHHDEIANRSQSLGDLVSGMLGRFDAIATQIENYYTTKVVPSGKSVANYDSLVADIAAKRAQVQTDLTNAQKDVAGFSCAGDNPKGQITQYRLDMQLVKKDLQNYRTSIKNLIVAIRSVVGETDESPKPSPSPVASPI